MTEQVAPLLVLKARAEARAILYRCGSMTWDEAMTDLHQYALASGIVDQIGAAATAAIIEAPFAQQEQGEPNGE